MKTFIVYVYGRIQNEIDFVKADTSKAALNLVIDEWIQDGTLAEVFKNYRIIENGDYTIRYLSNINEVDTLTFTIAGNKDIDTVVSELHDNEVYTLEN